MNKEQKQQKKCQLLEAAMEVFSAKGYAATRIDDIAEIAGVSKGSVYNYFSSKQELFHELFLFSVAEDTSKITALFESDESARDKVVGAVRIMIQRFHTNNCVGKLFMEYWATASRVNEDNEFAQTITGLYEKFQNMLEQILEHGYQAGEIGLIASPKISAKMLIALIDGLGLQLRVLDMGDKWTDDDFQEVIKTIENILDIKPANSNE